MAMSNNEPDYKDNLAFEKDMTWEEFVEWCESKNIIEEIANACLVIKVHDKDNHFLRLFITNICVLDNIKCKSFKAIKKVIEAIMEGVE